MVQIAYSSVVAFSIGIIFVTRKETFTVAALFGWMCLVAILHMIGAIIGVYVVRTQHFFKLFSAVGRKQISD